MVESVGNNGAYYVRQSHFDSDRMAGSVAHWKNNTATNDSTINALSVVDNNSKSSNVTAPTASFGELLDIVNPLHHLPVVGDVYRNISGDKISPVAQIVGGGIYGGGLGALSALANAAVQEHAGEDSLASAVISSLKSDNQGYGFVKDERSAGMNKAQTVKQEEAEIVAKTPETIEVASTIIPQSKPRIDNTPSKNTNLFEQMNIEKREPVTRVSIDVAAAEVLKPKRQQWNFNS